MYSNYEKIIKSDPTYYTGIASYYFKKVISPSVLIRKIRLISSKIFSQSNQVQESQASIDTIREKISFYSDLIPDKNKQGFVNKPLIDPRLEKIFSPQPDIKIPIDTEVIDKVSGLDLTLLADERA